MLRHNTSTPRRWRIGERTLRAIVLACVFAAFAALTPARAQTVVPDNPSCASLGYAYGFKPQPEPPPSGTYFFPGDALNSVTITSDGTYFDWTSTLSLDAVIVIGSSDANLYTYDPEATSDTGLHSPINAGTGFPYAISHIEFCYDYELGIQKDASTQWTRDIAWTIEKTVSPENFQLFVGGSGAASYTVSVVKTVSEAASLTGNIYIVNNTPISATVTSVVDAFNGEALAVTCPGGIPQTVPPGGSLTCAYQKAYYFPGLEPVDGTNTVTVVSTGIPGGAASAPVHFERVVNGYDAINVGDTNGPSWSTSASATWDYLEVFDCSTDPSAYTNGTFTYQRLNTAFITETGQSDEEVVNLYCYAPVISKMVFTRYDRIWNWTIDKSADQTDLLLSDGQQFLVNYQVALDAASVDDTIAVWGEIQVINPHPTETMVVSLSDVLSNGTTLPLLCSDPGAFTVPPGGAWGCDYGDLLNDINDVDDLADLVNTATAILNGVDFVATADVDFGQPEARYGECGSVYDTDVDFLAWICSQMAPVTFNYSLYFGAHPDADVVLECGDNSHTNVATGYFAQTTSDSWVVNATVACELGCTLTPGYWKTHSEYGPAPYDDTWAMLASGADTPFFLSGQTYYQVLWVPPAGNVYYNLSFPYIAAQLNMLKEASVPDEVQAAFNTATGLFNTYTAAQVATMKGKNGEALRAQFIALEEILTAYNEGLVGPGHCSEEVEMVAVRTAGEVTLAVSEATEAAAEAEVSAAKDGTAEAPAEASATATLPTEFALTGVYPNPFRAATTVAFALPEAAAVTVTVYDLLGREVARLVDEALEAGAHRAVWEASGAPSGTYVVLLRAGSFTASRSVVLVR